MSFELRPYQKEAEAAILSEWEKGNKKTILNLATGLGKTVVFSNVAKRMADSGKRVLVLAHRGELLDQAAKKIKDITGYDSAYEKAEQTSLDADELITVGSIQTISRKERLKKFPRNYFSEIIVDEAHHCMADTYQRVLKHFNNAYVLGVTATPNRGDKQELAEYFDSQAFEFGMLDGIAAGYLCPIKAQLIPLKVDITKVGMSSGDFSLSGSDTAITPYLDKIADVIAEKYADRKTVIFLPLVDTSQKMCQLLNQKGLPAVEINGTTKNRDQLFADFRDGKYKVLCNAMLATEGWDCPPVDCIVVLRPTKIKSFYQQMVGRGTRLCPGKKELLLLDFLWLTTRMDLCRPTSLFSESYAQDFFMLEELKNGKSIDLSELADYAKQRILEEKERALAKQLEQMRGRKERLIDPMAYSLSIGVESLLNYQPTFAWERANITQSQIEMLERNGINTSAIKTKGHASKIIEQIISRTKAGLSTPKQMRCLEQYGFKHVGQWLFTDAHEMIGKISHNGWIVPSDITAETYVPESIVKQQFDVFSRQ